jgi:nanoRNase/pAp phosphatase (c-di-AMP/oligoRNAs hydrolase)
LQGDLAAQQRIKVSLRSKGEEDTTVISQAYGGGGHRNASGFTLPVTEFDSWVVQRPNP